MRVAAFEQWMVSLEFGLPRLAGLYPVWNATARQGRARRGLGFVSVIKRSTHLGVTGNATTSETEHNRAHRADRAIEGFGRSSEVPHTATVAQVVEASEDAMIAIRPDCAAQILAATQAQFGTRNPDQLLRAKRLPPLPEDTINAIRSGATAQRP